MKLYYKMRQVFYYKMQQKFITKCVRFFITKYDSCYKMRSFYKMRLHCPKLTMFILCSLIHLSIVMYTLGFSHNKTNCIRNLEICLKNEFFTMETLHLTNKSNELSFETNFDLLAISKIQYRSNHLY